MKKYILVMHANPGTKISTMLNNKPVKGEFVIHESVRYKVVWVAHHNHIESTHLGVEPA